MLQRNIVLWCGSRTNRRSAIEFENRRLHLKVVKAEIEEADLLSARGIVFAFGNNRVSEVRQLAEANVQRAIDHGLQILVLANDDALLRYADEEFGELKVPKYERRLGDIAGADHEIAQAMLMTDPKRSYSATLQIEHAQEPTELLAPDELLLRRAFSDCRMINISPLSGGKTAEAYMVKATFAPHGSPVGPRPLPFFAKLSSRRKIDDEVGNYSTYATYFIPFHLRPNLDETRCLLGFEQGLLVGNFVERAEPLWRVARRGNARAAIRSLFDVTLRGWRDQGFERGLVKDSSVAGALGKKIFDHRAVRPEHLRRAKELGLSRTPKEMWEILLGKNQCYYSAPMHGDLHPDNVFVRGGDAILIDLGSVKHGPLSGDLACLETSFAFGNYDDDDDAAFNEEAWVASIDQLYDARWFRRVPPRAMGSGVRVPLFNCARQVRSIALPGQACGSEYISAVAMYLSRRAMHPGDGPDGFRRAYALVIADRLIGALEDGRFD